MSIYYSSEAGLRLLCHQLFLLTIFCLPGNNEDWGQSESEGKAGRGDPAWNHRGDTMSHSRERSVPPRPTCTAVLVRGAGVTPHPAHRPLLGRLSRRKPPPGVSSGSSRGPSHPPQSLLRPLSFAASRPFTALRCSPTGSLSFPSWFSGLLPARLETQASRDLPPASELSSPRPPPWELG